MVKFKLKITTGKPDNPPLFLQTEYSAFIWLNLVKHRLPVVWQMCIFLRVICRFSLPTVQLPVQNKHCKNVPMVVSSSGNLCPPLIWHLLEVFILVIWHTAALQCSWIKTNNTRWNNWPSLMTVMGIYCLIKSLYNTLLHLTVSADHVCKCK